MCIRDRSTSALAKSVSLGRSADVSRSHPLRATVSRRMVRGCPALQVREKTEVMINNDSGGDHALWRAALTGANRFLIYSKDIHEIRAYNRMSLMAESEMLVTLQARAPPRPLSRGKEP
eukprot:1426909-Pyramimonas_sp.AAC.1